MDPISILKAGIVAYQAGNLGVEMWLGKHSDTLASAIDMIVNYEESDYEEERYLSKAESLLESIPDDEKDYILTGKYFYLGYCYLIKDMFEASKRYLDYAIEIPISKLTACSDIMEDMQSRAKVLLVEVEKALIAKKASREYSNINEQTESETNESMEEFICLRDEYIDMDIKSDTELKDFINKIKKSMDVCDFKDIVNYKYLLSVVRLEYFVNEWLCNHFKNYPGEDSQVELQEFCLVEGIEEIYDCKVACPEDKEYMIVNATLNMLKDFWYDSCYDLEEYTSSYSNVLKECHGEENTWFSMEWLEKMFNASYSSICNTCSNIASSSINKEEQEYLNELKEILVDGEISPRERRLLDKIRTQLGISEERAAELEASLSSPVLTTEEQEYLDEYKEIIAEGKISDRDQRFLEKLKKANAISDERAKEIENLVK